MAKPWVNASKTICVDYNGVLDEYRGYRKEVYPPKPGAREFLQTLKNAGYKIVILTSADKNDVASFLTANNMANFVDVITNEKVPAIIYVDDRAVRFDGDFSKVLQEILKFIPYWENEDHNGLG